MYNNVYANKKVLVIGNTGFKGSWLSIWLLKLGAEVYGISKDVPTTPSIFDELNLQEKINYQVADINDRDKILQLIDDLRPDFLFNLAAQPIVSKSYSEPIETINTNVLGTAHILEALRIINHNCIAVMITSDKCYENVEWIWGYKESDHLGGKDPYSASKGACEIIIHAYFHSYLKNSNVRLASVRAGNVIGGGDWAESRIVPDSMKAWSQNLPVTIRNPNSTRPWQHVLEPLSGYLRVGQKLKEEEKINGEAYNFGPSAEQVHTVAEMLEQLGEFWKFTTKQPKYIVQSSSSFHEAGLLKLNCDKALYDLKWKAVLNFKETMQLTAEWYQAFYNRNSDLYLFSFDQIDKYVNCAKERGLAWVN